MEVHGSLPSNVQQHFFKAFFEEHLLVLCVFCICGEELWIKCSIYTLSLIYE